MKHYIENAHIYLVQLNTPNCLRFLQMYLVMLRMLKSLYNMKVLESWHDEAC